MDKGLGWGCVINNFINNSNYNYSELFGQMGKKIEKNSIDTKKPIVKCSICYQTTARA